MKSLVLTILVVAIAAIHPRPATADDRGTIADALSKVASATEALARTANASDDRAVRKKFAPKATEISDDLNALVRRARKDVPIAAIQTDAEAIEKDTAKLVDLADEASDKTERKSLRAQAQLIDQQLGAVHKQIAEAATKSTKPAAAKPAPAMTAAAFKQLVDTVEGANTDPQKHDVVAAAAVNWFTAAQIGVLMDLINTEPYKVNVASTLWPHLVDPQNGFLVFGKLELEGSKAELRRRVGK